METKILIRRTITVFTVFLIGVLGLLLPWHATISALVPELRWWKELTLIALGIISEGHILFESVKTRRLRISTLEIFCTLFVLYGIILALMSSQIFYSAIALRYIITGIVALCICFTLGRYSSEKLSTIFVQFITISTALSVLLWLYDWSSGFSVLQNIYSETISSWVPGQVTQLYHEAWGLPRMQGGLSGPVAFGHLCLLCYCLNSLTRFKKWLQWTLKIILIGGILASLSRGAWLGMLVFMGHEIWQWGRKNDIVIGKKWRILAGIIVVIVGSIITPKILQRNGTMDHFTQPIEVLKIGIQSPIFGDLGSVGPAKRMQNMATINSDKAPIAENVLIDIFAQMGLVGLLLYLMIWWQIFTLSKNNIRVLVVIFFGLMQLATLWDMTPLSIAVMGSFGLLMSNNRAEITD